MTIELCFFPKHTQKDHSIQPIQVHNFEFFIIYAPSEDSPTFNLQPIFLPDPLAMSLPRPPRMWRYQHLNPGTNALSWTVCPRRGP